MLIGAVFSAIVISLLLCAAPPRFSASFVADGRAARAFDYSSPIHVVERPQRRRNSFFHALRPAGDFNVNEDG
jgi:hypothetical protein